MQSLERMQALAGARSFEFHLIFPEEATIDGKIVLVPEQQGGGFFAVASRATGLLRIVVGPISGAWWITSRMLGMLTPRPKALVATITFTFPLAKRSRRAGLSSHLP